MKQTTQTTINKDGIMQENITKQEAEALYQKKTDALQLTDQIPLVDGTPSAGSSAMAAHGDHVHPVPAEIPKNLYNLGAYDTYVPNGDGTGTVTRKTDTLSSLDKVNWNIAGEGPNCFYCTPFDFFPTRISCNKYTVVSVSNIGSTDKAICINNRSIIIHDSAASSVVALIPLLEALVVQYELASEYQYTEQVIENQPIRPANQEEELYWHHEWEKGLNLIDFSEKNKSTNGVTATISNNGTITITGTATANGYIKFNISPIKSSGTYTIVNNLDLRVGLDDATNNSQIYATANNKNTAFFSSDAVVLWLNIVSGTTYNTSGTIMLTRGKTPYPYQSYNGGIIREADLTPVKFADSATATSGTLTEEQLATLQNTDRSILFNNELYVPADREHAAGYLVYSHLGYESGYFWLKGITITVSTKGWVLSTKQVNTPEPVTVPPLYRMTNQGTWKDGSNRVISYNFVFYSKNTDDFLDSSNPIYLAYLLYRHRYIYSTSNPSSTIWLPANVTITKSDGTVIKCDGMAATATNTNFIYFHEAGKPFAVDGSDSVYDSRVNAGYWSDGKTYSYQENIYP